MTHAHTKHLRADEQSAAIAADALRAGRLVAFPTETVYGLGSIATSDQAVARIFEAKQRPWHNPLIVHVTDPVAAAPLVRWSAIAERLAARFWPGPLTLVLPRAESCQLSRLVSAGLDTVALRAPAHPLAQTLLRATALPVAAPSANPAGAVSPTRAYHVAQALDGKVEVILDGGACPLGLESTVIDLTGASPRLLRPGGLARGAIEAEIGPLAIAMASPDEYAPDLSPGQQKSHYAPGLPVRLDAHSVAPDEALLAFGPRPLRGAAKLLNLSADGDLEEAASNLFVMLRELDRPAFARIAVMPIPSDGVGEAICDRLIRASAPRPTRL